MIFPDTDQSIALGHVEHVSVSINRVSLSKAGLFPHIFYYIVEPLADFIIFSGTFLNNRMRNRAIRGCCLDVPRNLKKS